MRRLFIGIFVVATLTAFFLGLASNVSIRTSALDANPTSLPQGFESAPLQVSNDSAPFAAAIQSARKVVIRLPAVDKEGNGALADFTVEAVPGKGRVFIGFDSSPLVNSDTQSSLRVALDVAKRLSKTDANRFDVFYSFSTQSDVVGGKSAGAAATVATLAAFSGNALRPDVLLTGTVEPDGTIGPVGKILEKAKAVRAAGYRTFLVPQGESVQNVVVEECKQQQTDNGFMRQCASTSRSQDIASLVPGLSIVEVKDVLDAYRMIKSG
ncbi:hypothetical protein HY994_01485 [Candidatus Micrarchaeota archaeon]|nr:hypothetical protein [Candidatus Micrarchaeota archaeon]